MQRSIIFILIGLSALLIFGCGVDNDRANTLTVAIIADDLEDSDSIVKRAYHYAPFLYSTLFAYNDNFAIINDLALNYTISDDRLVWTVKIRIDAVFHNRIQLNSKDVVYTYTTAMASESGIDLSMLEKVEATDAATIVFTLIKPDMSFMHKLATIGIIPQQDVDADDDEQRPVGSGPYRFIYWKNNQEFVVEANARYYGAVPEIKRVIFLFLDQETAIRYAKEGKVDVVPVPILESSIIVPEAKIVRRRSAEKRGILFPNMYKSAGSESNFEGNPITADISIRKALQLVVNRDLFVAGVLNGNGAPAYGPADGFPWDEPAGRTVQGDIRRALLLMQGAGWVDLDNDGIYEKQGRRAEFSLYYPVEDVISESMAVACANLARDIKIKINVEGKRSDELERLILKNAVLISWGSQDPFAMYELYHSTNSIKGRFPTYYKNTAVDTYLDNAKASSSFVQAIELLRQAQWDGRTGVSIRGDLPILWLTNISHTYFINNRVLVGNTRMEKPGYGWPVTENIAQWRWKK